MKCPNCDYRMHKDETGMLADDSDYNSPPDDSIAGNTGTVWLCEHCNYSEER